MDKIHIINLEVFANHGLSPEENSLGQKFILSAVLFCDTREAGLSDDLSKSIHYGEVSHMMKSFVEENTFKLLETVVEQLAEKMLLTIPSLLKVELALKKPWAPVGLSLETVAIEIERCWHTVYIALGSNMGDKKAYLMAGIKGLEETKTCQIIKVSEFLETPPYGMKEQDDFLNGVLKMRTLLTPSELLDKIHEIENREGRERKDRWEPRTLDLDILFYDDLVLDSENLRIPHPDMQNRLFVLKPLQQIDPYLRHPVSRKTIEEMLGALQ